MLLTNNNTKHINTVTHEGKVLIVATVAEPGQPVKLFYTVKQDGFEDSALQNPGGTGWEAFKEVPLPNDNEGDLSVAAKELAELTYKEDNVVKYLLRSVYNSAALTADAPVQLVSHDGYVYLFRQSTANTLLADRFVLDGMLNVLTPRLEVRYKRNRQRHKPIKDMKINSGGQMESLDSPDFRDMANQPFHEPSTEICPGILNQLRDGWFGVAVTATNEADRYRWHIFAYNKPDLKVDLLTLRAGQESMFTVQDYWFRRIDADTDAVSYNSIPGLIRRRLDLQNETSQRLPVSNGLAVVKYDVQTEQQTQAGKQWMRDASKLLLAIPTDQGVAALSFAIAADGTLAQIVKQPTTATLRSKEREILLPVNLLDKIRAVGDASPAPKGVIAGMSRSTDDNTADRVRVQASDGEAVERLNLGDTVKLSNTTSYNGLYQAHRVEDGSFTIDAPFKFNEVGRWEVMEEEDTGLVFDGMVAGYEKTGDGKLKVHALNHKLEQGDWVQIVDTPDLGGEYPILQHDEDSFTVQRLWVNGEAVNLKLESNKRRGLVFDGQKDWIEIPLAEPLKLGVGFTFEAWVKLNRGTDQTLLATEIEPAAAGASKGWRATLGVNNGKFSFAYLPVNLAGETEKRLVSAKNAQVVGQWVHVACAFDGTALRLLENGIETARLTSSSPPEVARYNESLRALRAEVERLENVQKELGTEHPANYEAGRLVIDKQVLSAGKGDTVVLASEANQPEPEQMWHFEALGGQDFVIHNLATKQVLTKKGATGVNLSERLPDNSNQIWDVVAKSNQYSTAVFLRPRGLKEYALDAISGTPTLGYCLDDLASQEKRLFFFAQGKSKLVDAKAALSDAQAQPKIPRIPLSNVRALTLAGQSPTGVAATPAPTPVQLLLQGQLADVRVWTGTRQAKDIENNMHLQLTGRETGLEGYWRLGGVAADEEGVQRVYDFGVNANHGLAHGAPYGGGVTLKRTLGNNTTLATRYSNPELFAVSEGATYVETFEFHTDVAVVPNNADNQNGRIFKPALWGRLSRNAEEMQTFGPLAEAGHYQFDPAGEAGWHRATCRFIVPQGVRLLRCFEVSDVKGNWTTLEIRRHAVKLLSDTVTQSQANEIAKFQPLTGATGVADPASKLPELEGKESEEAKLVTRKKLLEEAIAAANDKTKIRNDIIAQQKVVDSLSTNVASLLLAYTNQQNNPLNYWCKIVARHSGKCLDVLGSLNDNGAWVWQFEWQNQENAKWALEPIGDGYYKIKAKHSGKCLDVMGRSNENKAWVWQYEWENQENAKWALESTGDGYYKIKAKHSQKYLNVHGGNENGEYVCQWEWANQNNAKWKIEKIGEPINFNITDAWNAWQRKTGEYNAADAELRRLKAILDAAEKGKAQLDADLVKVVADLATVRGNISTLTTAYLGLVAQANKAQSMPNLAGQVDPRGLKVQGALLPFAQAATRLHALESCAGRVTLSYQDSAGNLRQTHYDTTYDSDAKAEEWLPEGYRAALKLDGIKTAPGLPAEIFSSISNQITIEFWAKGGEALPKAVTFLGARNNANAPCLRIQLPNENGMVVWEAGLASGDKLIDRLAAPTEASFYRERWTHWAFVKDCDKGEMRIYRNGKPFHKNDPKAKEQPVVLSQPIRDVTQATLGDFPGVTAKWSGQIAELRIWNVALGERELETNSMLTLSGNEPGLIAYYPMNEATGNEARDRTGHGHKLTLTGAVWTPCSAPIGRFSPAIELLATPMVFDGSSTFVQLPALDLKFSAGLTIEARVRFGAFNKASRIVDLGIGQANQNILLSNTATSNGLYLAIIIDGQHNELKVNDVLTIGEWVHVAATIQTDGTSTLYVKGSLKVAKKLALPPTVVRTSNFVGKSNWSGDQLFKGEMEYVRVWQTALSADEIMRCASGQQIAPRIGGLISAEYSRVVVDPQRRKSAMMVRCLALADLDGLRLFDEQRIEELEMKWIGNAQINPTLIGYIEGAPPLPTENLTEEDDYNGATSVELIQSSEVAYSWTREQDASLGSEAEALLGVKSQTTAGIGVETTLEDIDSGGGFKMNFANHWQNASTVGTSHSLSQSDRLELRGSQEQDAYFPQLGRRFIPKNVGYALVTSGLADVFVSKLKTSGRMVGYQVLPVEGVPLDVNTITFMINPAYTMAGSLDGMTGGRATSQRVFGHVPEMRAQYGSLYPSSYFRLQEAYDLKARIDNQDQQHQAYFNQFNAGLVDETSLSNQVGDSSLDGGAVGLNSIGSSGGASSSVVKALDELIQAKQKQIDELKKATSVNKSEVDKLEGEVDDLRKQRQEQLQKEQGGRQTETEKRQKEIEAAHSDLSAREHASTSFAAWQRTMESLQIRAGKRNIVNTYIWDADGGLHAEEQQFASTVEHSVGGSFDLSIALGGQGKFAISKVMVESNAYATTNMTQTMSKTQASSKGMELHVDLSGVESRGVTDHRDYPILPGEKVDRYRFMSFYLENNVSHWHDFFNTVVDPEWLASNDEEARALRQTQNALPNKVWRVLHRVTYVERPVLLGFGRQQPARVEVADEMQKLRGQVGELKGSLEVVIGKLNELLDKS